MDVRLVSEMRADGVAFFLAEAAFEERAEDDGLDFGPVFLGRFDEQADFARLEFDRFDFGEEAAVEVVHTHEASAARRLWVIHLAKETAEQIVTAPATAAFLQQTGKQALGSGARRVR